MHFFLIGFGFKYMSVGGGFDGDIGRGVTVGGAVSDIEWGGTLCGAVVGDLVCI
jgi:hypothetical protein